MRGPSLQQVDARRLMRGLGDRLGRVATFDDIPDAMLDRLAARGIEWVYLLGVWSTGAAGRDISRSHPGWRAGYLALLPDLEERDICGSCFAVTAYRCDPAMGGDDALGRLRARLAQRGVKLMLDFVPNHTAIDHPWASTRPELYVPCAPGGDGVAVGGAWFAHGRDPNFPGWPDTLQLDYARQATVDAMRAEMQRAARSCDGLRCDMAMLLLPDVFERSWGRAALPFWGEAIGAVRAATSGFVFMAEVYWGLEARLIALGFDYAYDKTLYDRLVHGDGPGVRAHLAAPPEWQRHLARFLENHDETRAAAALDWPRHQAAAVLAFGAPGLRFFGDGELEGRRRQASVHLNRAPAEADDPAVAAFYERMLPALRTVDGDWTALEPRPAWDGNPTADGFVAYAWDGRERWLAVINLQGTAGQCYVRLGFAGVSGVDVSLVDALGPARYVRAGDDLLGRGMYFDMPAWGYHLFRVSVEPPEAHAVTDV